MSTQHQPIQVNAPVRFCKGEIYRIVRKYKGFDQYFYVIYIGCNSLVRIIPLQARFLEHLDWIDTYGTYRYEDVLNNGTAIYE